MNYYAIYLMLVIPMGEFGETKWQVEAICETIEECEVAKRHYQQTTPSFIKEEQGVFICTIAHSGDFCKTAEN